MRYYSSHREWGNAPLSARETEENKFIIIFSFLSLICETFFGITAIFSARLGERSVRIREVEGSNPFRSTKAKSHPFGWLFVLPAGGRCIPFGGRPPGSVPDFPDRLLVAGRFDGYCQSSNQSKYRSCNLWWRLYTRLCSFERRLAIRWNLLSRCHSLLM